MPREQRRFPDQLDWLQSRLDQVPESEVRWQADFVAQGNALHQVEIPLMMRLQQWLGPDVWWLSVSNLFGSGGFQLALIPLLLPLLGWPRLRQLLFAMLWLGLLVQASKEGIGWPRPFHLQPLLATHSAQGFGMPSGHTASALLFWGALLGWLWPARRGLAYSLALLLALTTGLARVWLGVHFISDVAAGLLIGALLLAARPYWRLDQRSSVWGLLIAAALVCAGLTQSAHLAGIGLAALGIWVGGLLTLTCGGYPPHCDWRGYAGGGRGDRGGTLGAAAADQQFAGHTAWSVCALFRAGALVERWPLVDTLFLEMRHSTQGQRL